MNSAALTQKVWNLCHTLRDDGVGYSDYLEQLTYLLFLKIKHEYAISPNMNGLGIPPLEGWCVLRQLKGARLLSYYARQLKAFGRQNSILGAIFKEAQNKIQDPAKLARLIKVIDAETWLSLQSDTKGDIYEGLLKRNAEDVKSGAGQYFTPRPLIRAIVSCIQPIPMKTVADPACGTGGFFLGVYEWLNSNTILTKTQRSFLQNHTFRGWEIVPAARRLCLMNLFLHGIGNFTSDCPVSNSDALAKHPGEFFDYVLANPPFGRKSSIRIGNQDAEEEDGPAYDREDFWETTSNKQLNFLQHVLAILKETGKAAIVLPDNVLFEGGASERVRRKLLQCCEVHTLLRLPTGIFYAQGVKANVLFFENRPKRKQIHTHGLWVYDLRSESRFTLRTRPLTDKDLVDFVRSYMPGERHRRRPSKRFRFFPYAELLTRDKVNLDISWPDEYLELDPQPISPDAIAKRIIEHLETALDHFKAVALSLEN